MPRRILQLGLTAALVVLGVVVAARAAEPSVRPILYPAPTEIAEVRNSALPTTTTSTTTTSTTTEPPATISTTTTTTSEPPATTTTTEAPLDEPVDDEPTADELAVLGDEYGWFERGDRVRDLQRLLGLSADGVYGAATRAAHLAEVQDRGLAADGVPPVPTTSTTTTTTTTEAPVDEVAVLLASYGWNERGAGVRVLQGVLGVGIDGHYGPATRAAHLAEVQDRGLAADGVPPVPTTTAPPTTTTTAAPPEPPPTTTEAPPDTGTDTPTTTAAPTTTAPSAFGGMGAEILGGMFNPCIADGDLSDCPPDLVAFLTGVVPG